MRLNTFGRPHVTDDGGEEVALQPLPVAVLAYLAVGGPRDRDHLADLFWHNSKNGLNSLSTTLNRIRAEAPGSVWVRGNTLVGTDMTSDIGELRDAIDRLDFESVAQLYGAPFLGSLKLRRQSVEFEEWVLDERTTLASMVELTLLQRGRDLHEAGEIRSAANAAEQAWEITIRDGFPSPNYFEMYHRILASAARPSAQAVRTMAEEFGVALPPVDPFASESSGRTAQTSAPRSTSSRAERPSSGAATRLFGCEEELNAIAVSVASQRLTSIVGLGGSGKTRLATEFFDNSTTAEDFPYRYWFNLRDVTDHDLVGPAIAATLGHRFDDVSSLAEGLPDDQPVLLVLDNFEHLLAAAGIAKELVDSNEAIRILATSRVPLEVADESLVQLNGLDTSGDELSSPAEQLFLSAARRAGVSEDRLSGSSRAAVRGICRRVGGHPLALELAGGWAQILSPTEILNALSRDNELLGSSMVGDPRTMDDVLDQSWSTLPEAEQNTLMLLATFPSGCLTKEALALPELSISSVGRLVQHSLVNLQVEGRITLHPLIAGHAVAELERRPNLHRTFHQVLSGWCQRFVAAIPSETDRTHADSLEAEIANFTGAWLWDAQHGSWQLHQTTVDSLRQFFTESGRVSEGRVLFATVADALRSDSNSPEDLLAAIVEALGWFQTLLGELTHARALLTEALTRSSSDTPHAHAQVLRSLGVLQLNTGEIDEAAANFTAGLALIADEPCALTASLQCDLAQAHHYRGARDQAIGAARLALQAGRSASNWTVMTKSYLLLADIEVESDPQRAIVLLNEGWVIAKDASLDNLAIYFPHILGLAHLNLQQAEPAESYFTDGIQAASKVGQRATVCANYVGRAEARLLGKNPVGAIDDLKTGIRLALKSGSARYLMWAAIVSCRAAATLHEPSLPTKELLLLALRHPATDQDARYKAVETLRELFDDDAAQLDVNPITDGEASVELDEVSERALQLLAPP